MKYIMLLDDTTILFPDFASRKEMANGRAVKSAWFVLVETSRNWYDDIIAHVVCYGNSYSLNVESDKRDEKIIANMFRYGL